MKIQIQKAQRSKTKMRLMISWASWSGKTYSSLLMAKWLCWWDMSKVCVIDTEHNSASLYSDLWDFSVVQLDPDNCTTESLTEAFNEIEKAWFECIVRDSSTHRWNYILETNDKFTKQNYGNSFTSWRQTNKYYVAMINRMLSSSCHVIATARSKSDYVIETNDKGKASIKKVGLKAETRSWFDFEFTICFDVNEFHLVDKVAKDRTGLFANREEPFKITEETGKQILDRCESGADVAPEPKQENAEELTYSKQHYPNDAFNPKIDLERFRKALDAIDAGKTTVNELIKRFRLSDEQWEILKEKYGVEC